MWKNYFLFRFKIRVIGGNDLGQRGAQTYTPCPEPWSSKFHLISSGSFWTTQTAGAVGGVTISGRKRVRIPLCPKNTENMRSLHITNEKTGLGIPLLYFKICARADFCFWYSKIRFSVSSIDQPFFSAKSYLISFTTKKWNLNVKCN